MTYEVLTVPHRARPGESLLDVAARYTGSPGRWLELAAVNRGPLRSATLAGVEAEAPLPAGLHLQLPAAWAPRLPRRTLGSLGVPADWAEWEPFAGRLQKRGLAVPISALAEVRARMSAGLSSVASAAANASAPAPFPPLMQDDLAFVAAYWWTLRALFLRGKTPLPPASDPYWKTDGGGGFLPAPAAARAQAEGAAVWGTMYGSAMKPGMARTIPWEAVPWGAVDWKGTNFLALNMTPLAALWLQRGTAAFGAGADAAPLPDISFLKTDWSGYVWGSTTQKWADVRWADVVWEFTPWVLVGKAPDLFAEATTTTFERIYKGSSARYNGTMVSPTTWLMLKLFERFPQLTLTSLLPEPKAVPATAQEGGPPGGRPPTAIRKNADGSSEVTKEIEDWWERQKKTDLPPVKVEVSGVSTLTMFLGAAAAAVALYFALSPKSRRRLPPCPPPPRSDAPDKPRPRSAPGGTRPSRLAPSTSTRTSTRRRPPPPTRPTRWPSSPRRSRSLPAPSSRRTPLPSSR